jgi:glutamate---cysteine ligase / carboxylate-amine ligase
VKATVAPDWATWNRGEPAAGYTLGVEEEVMLLEPNGWSLAQAADMVLPSLTPELADRVTPETHGSVVELRTHVNPTVADAVEELLGWRRALVEELAPMGLRAASSGTHPFAVWHDTVVAGGERQGEVYGSMRELARREPTCALHVHVGVSDPEDAIRVVNRLRGHLPTMLALSANSPFWQGRDTGLASARTPLFQAFPRVGIPRAFEGYEDYVSTVDLLVRCEAFPEPTFLWWDVRPQPGLGTVEVRIMDAQATVSETASLVALVQSLVRLELEEGFVAPELLRSPEVLDENRFLAARDGMEAELIDPVAERRVPVREQFEPLLQALAPHAYELGCHAELQGIGSLAAQPGATAQLAAARRPRRLRGLVQCLADAFCESGPGFTRLDPEGC